MTARLAIATCSAYPRLLEDDLPLVSALEARGVAVEVAVWDVPRDWTAFDAVLLRSVWDYYERPGEFFPWLAGLERAGVRTWNPPSLVRWNGDKRYLHDLAARGVAIPPTLVVPEGTAVPEAQARVAAMGWDEVVVKPAVSGGAWRTHRLRAHQVAGAGAAFAEVLSGGALLAQPFLPEIEAEGEVSLVFFEGRYSHAVRKRAKPGDWRVQWTHGGTHVAMEPTPALLEQARAVLAAAPEPGLYARVDGIVRDGRLLLMELEQVEPFLFFGEGPAGAVRLAQAVALRLCRA